MNLLTVNIKVSLSLAGKVVLVVPHIDCHSPLFFRKMVEIERFALRTAILHECQNYLGGGGAPPPLGTFENQDARH